MSTYTVRALLSLSGIFDLWKYLFFAPVCTHEVGWDGRASWHFRSYLRSLPTHTKPLGRDG